MYFFYEDSVCDVLGEQLKNEVLVVDDVLKPLFGVFGRVVDSGWRQQNQFVDDSRIQPEKVARDVASKGMPHHGSVDNLIFAQNCINALI